MTRILIISLIVFSVFSCKKKDLTIEDNQSSEPAELSLSLNDNNATPLQVVKIEVLTNYAFSTNSYSGLIDGNQLDISVIRNEGLFFEVPKDINAGTYTFTTTIDGQDFSYDMNISNAQPLADKLQFIENEVTELLNSHSAINDFILQTGDDFPGGEFQTANWQTVDNAKNDFISKYNVLSQTEKEEFADWLNANYEAVGEDTTITDLLIYVDDNSTLRNSDSYPETEMDRFLTKSKSLISKKKLRIMILGGTVGIGATSANPLGWTIAAFAGYQLVKELIETNSFLLSNANRAIIADYTSIDIGYNFQKSSDVEALSGYETNIGFQTNYRNLNNNDISSSALTISEIIEEISSFEVIWNKIANSIPTGLSGNSYHPKNISDNIEISRRPLPGTWDLEDINISGLTIDSKTWDGDSLKVLFSTTAYDLHNFDATFTYNHDGLNEETIVKNITVRGWNYFEGSAITSVNLASTTGDCLYTSNYNIELFAYKNQESMIPAVRWNITGAGSSSSSASGATCSLTQGSWSVPYQYTTTPQSTTTITSFQTASGTFDMELTANYDHQNKQYHIDGVVTVSGTNFIQTSGGNFSAVLDYTQSALPNNPEIVTTSVSY